MSLSRALRLKDLSAAHAAIMGRAATLDSRIAALAGVQPIITGAMNINQAWVRGAPCAVAAIPGWGFTRALAAYGERPDLTLEPFASGAPRLVNGRGQLIEGARTNLCLRSQEFDNASWTKRGTATITADAAVAPDGTATADLISGLDSGSNDVFQVVTLASAARGEPSLYIKRVSTSGIIRIGNPSDGTKGDWTVDLSLLPDGWSRITRANAAVAVATEFTGSATNGAGIHIRRTVAGTVSFYVWGGQFEAGTHSSSYIPTTTASVTRPADDAQISLSAISATLGSVGSAYIKCSVGSIGSGDKRVLCFDNANGRLIEVSTATIRTFDGTNVVSSGQTALANTAFKAASSWGSGLNISAKGATAVSGTFDGSMASGATLLIGSTTGTFAADGYIEEFALWDVQLGASPLERLSA